MEVSLGSYFTSFPIDCNKKCLQKLTIKNRNECNQSI